jgi:branched-chain amino acid transport system substrate-binding protein
MPRRRAEKIEGGTTMKTLKAAIAAAAFGALTMPAVAQDIKFSLQLPLTGAVAFTGQLNQAGWQHAVDWINKNGGVKGRKFDPYIYDSEYKVDVGIAGWKKAIANGEMVFSVGDGTPFVRAVTPENNDRYKIMMTNTGYASDVVDVSKYPYHIMVGPTYSDQFDILYKYIKDKQGSGPAPKIALVYTATEFGRDPIEHAKKRAKELGFSVVAEEETKWSGIDVTPHVIKLRNAAPDYIIFQGYAGNLWPEIVKLSREYGIKGQFMGTVYGVQPDLVKGAGPAADGMLGVMPFEMMVAGNNGWAMKAIDAALKGWGKPYAGYTNVGYIQGWVLALFMRDVIGKVIESGKPLNGDNLVKAANELKNWDSGGMIGTPVSLAKQRLPVGRIYRFSVKADSFSFKPETDWIKLD